jgi:dTDP-4-amino-4,6-dideoxygalactose transaminase
LAWRVGTVTMTPNDAPVTRYRVPFNRPYVTGAEIGYIQEAIDNAHLSGNGPFSRRCSDYLREMLGASAVLLTPSGTDALEMIAILADVGEGDEVILPSYTFSSTATAFVLRGAVPVFVDIREDTLNIDPRLVEAAVTDRTKAIMAVHYAGVGCDMDELGAIASGAGVMLVEDAAQGYAATWRDRPLGALSTLGAMSFHETKNVISGEGGALIVNDPALAARAEIIHEKGTNRRAFFRGQVDKYSWVDTGSSFVASELATAFLWAQLERGEWITAQRLALWDAYHAALAGLEERGLLRRPFIPPESVHNAHMYYVLLPTGAARDAALTELAEIGVNAVFHYVPLHSSPAGRRFGRTSGTFAVTDDISARLLRLPMWVGMSDQDTRFVVDSLEQVLTR